ncbi:hypothetical protein [uncultured Arcticibacterium sp.]|uniref:hypothetical protein n=1 Tax=uncultured Arcticibacterium sp. TaxID=2173042 RepID=UPI0030F9C4A1
MSNSYKKESLNYTKTSKTDVDKVLRTLCYFDLFKYPLTAEEVFERSDIVSIKLVKEVLNDLVQSNKVFFLRRRYYSLNDSISLVERRLKGNKLCEFYFRKAQRITSFICKFPYVRSVMISGSLSKNYMDDRSDIDYFIITAPNRLWIARLFFFLTQKIIYLNNTKFLCFNYMIDTNALELRDKSIFTATEIATVIPTYGGEYYQDFKAKNRWIQEYYPNYPTHDISNLKVSKSWIKKVLEKCLNNSFGDWLDNFLMKKTEKRWRKIHKAEMFGINGENLVINRHVAKAHFGGNYQRILNHYQGKISDLEKTIWN